MNKKKHLSKQDEVKDLCHKLSDYMSKEDVDKVYVAYEIAYYAHDGQMRKSGDAYISHPIAVAMILAELKLDVASICSALLHDCIEDTSISKEEIKAKFGQEVANIVDGVTKLEHLSHYSIEHKQAENFRKLFLAMSGDVRVILIKLSDRLHNMRTISVMSNEAKQRIAKETLELHAPIAHRLGLNNFKSELENLAFKTLYPYRYAVISKHISNKLDDQEGFVEKMRNSIKQRLLDDKISAKIIGRKKDSYSIFHKMRTNQLKLKEVFDVYAFRLIVDTLEYCYLALGSVHNLYKPLPGKFKDYIALPKVNGYQSLHTILFAPNEILIEVQIRSKEMDFVAERGIAAHWGYKEQYTHSNNMQYWLKSLNNIQQHTQDSIEFLEEVKAELSPNEVFVFTPKGDIIRLPYNATALDFAYEVHTEIGNHCYQTKINKKQVDFSQKLYSGQTVYIKTKQIVEPKPSWLNYVVTTKARLAIKSSLKNYSEDKLTEIGRHLFNTAMENEGFSRQDISQSDWDACISYLSCVDEKSLFLKIGLREIITPIVINILFGMDKEESLNTTAIKHAQNMMVTFANCCHPLPGDKIIGAMSLDKGLIIHRENCANIGYVKSHQPQWTHLEWEEDNDKVFTAIIHCDVENRRGVLANLASTISKFDVSIEDIIIQEKHSKLKSLKLILLIKNVAQLTAISKSVQALDYIKEVSRQ